MLNKNIRELVEKYTFITKTTYYGGIVRLYYKDYDGNERFKKVPLRTNKDQLIRYIDSIKAEIGWQEKRMSVHEQVRKEIAEKDILISYIGEKNG